MGRGRLRAVLYPARCWPLIIDGPLFFPPRATKHLVSSAADFLRYFFSTLCPPIRYEIHAIAIDPPLFRLLLCPVVVRDAAGAR